MTGVCGGNGRRAYAMRSYLESVLLASCPGFAEEWAMLRATYPPDEPPSAAAFLGALRAHVHQRLTEGRVAEVARLLHTLERVLTEADPILRDLLEDTLIVPLAAACAATAIDPRLVLPHLGPRTRAAWERGG